MIVTGAWLTPKAGDGPRLRRGMALLLALGFVALCSGCGSAPAPRPMRSVDELLVGRAAQDRRVAHYIDVGTEQLIERVKTRYDAFIAEEAGAERPELNVLLISGGGDWGAFAAGFLKGWSRVPAGPMALPQFDVVTGVSTGALIAPFAFLGEAADLDTVLKVYRNPQKDWLRPRSLWAMMRGASSYARVPGLERDLRQALSMRHIERIVSAGDAGRLLAVNVTNIDTQEMHVWDLVAEARRARRIDQADRLYEVLLASAALPGLMPPREIDGVLYVDGGTTGNILVGGPAGRPEEDAFMTRWQERHPHLPLPRIRCWVIFNNEMRWQPEVVPAHWSAIMSRSGAASTRAATLNAMRLLLLQAELARFQYGAQVEVRIVAVPDGWGATASKPFDRQMMNALADLGEAMGANPASWQRRVASMQVEVGR